MAVTLNVANKAPAPSPQVDSRPCADALSALTGAGGFADQLHEQLQPADQDAAPPEPPAADKPAAEQDDTAAEASARPRSAPKSKTARTAQADDTPAAAGVVQPQMQQPDLADSADVHDDHGKAAAGGLRAGAHDDPAADVLAGANWLQQRGALKLSDTGSGKSGKVAAVSLDALAAKRQANGNSDAADTAAASATQAAAKSHAGVLQRASDAAMLDPSSPASEAPGSVPGSGNVSESRDAGPAQAAAAGLAPAGAFSPAAPVSAEVTLSTPVNSPAFRDQLAAQITTFTRDGVQEAVLNLNPADMGPITVAIAMDGTQARVDFQASSAATRELIESSLPALASALHGEGLTLSGGSVGDHRGSAHSQEPPAGGGDARAGRQSAARAEASSAAGAARAAAVPNRLDGRAVDTYA